MRDAPAASAGVDAREAERMIHGDEALRARLAEAVRARGAGYEPRTRHKNPDGSPKFVNRLVLETSPYLAQHAHNPVAWFPWGEDAFRVARALGRPVFLSIGYSTCHWCHVMEEESFEDLEIAAYLNEHYVCIKIDREERPDVDAVYMRAVQLLTGSGGWPMSVWLTHDRRPFYAGTYFPPRDGARGARKGFLTLAREQRERFTKGGEAVAADAATLAARIREDLAPPPATGMPGPSALQGAVELARRRYDAARGGARGRPKFPSSFPVRLLLRAARRAGEPALRDMAVHTLRAMAAGGIYDHVGGGFHRYSTDERWLVPHFEKMLYDNALLAVAYLEGWQTSGDDDLARVARETLDYVTREMSAPEGGYYSATDADSLTPSGRREEGWFFTWTPAEIESAIGRERARMVGDFFGVTPGGNFEGRSILHRPRPPKDAAAALGVGEADLARAVAGSIPVLRSVRGRRPPPLRDDKIQVSWNGLMIGAMARGGRLLGEPRFVASARRSAEILLARAWSEGRLRHSLTDGRASEAGFAEDYAFLAAGLVDLFEATGEPPWLEHAVALMDALAQRHAAPAGGYHRTASDAEELLAREVEMHDGAEPSAGAIAAMTELRLAALTTDDRWRRRAEATLRAFAPMMESAPAAVDQALLALDWHSDAAKEVLLVRPEGADEASVAPLSAVLRRTFLPNHVLVVADEGALAGRLGELVPWARGKPPRGPKPTAYVCERGACELPTTDPAVLARQLARPAPYPGPLER
jgi:uncharacterized protein YyaL (SSP411 family)